MTPWKLRQAAKLIQAGGVIAYPTEAVYGLGCDPLDIKAVEHICAIKQRPLSKGLILIGASIDQLEPWCSLTAAQRKKIRTSRTKPVTWIVPAAEQCPPWIRGMHAGIAVRLTQHPIAQRLCIAANTALVSTSANPAGRPPARSALRVQCQLGDQLDMIIHGAVDRTIKPSEIRDINSDRILRPA